MAPPPAAGAREGGPGGGGGKMGGPGGARAKGGARRQSMMIPTVAVQGATGRGAKASAAASGPQTYADFDMWESWDKAPGKVRCPPR